jgi:FkbM family methyltransferase
MTIRRLIRKLLNAGGYDIRPYQSMGRNPFEDMRLLLGLEPQPIVLDVGANVGQSIDVFRSYFPTSTIHSFEPSAETYRALSSKASGMKGVSTWNCGLGATSGRATLLENSHSVMSSFLELGQDGWGDIRSRTQIDITTVDDFCKVNGINVIDILKSDTQGFELEVFKGAKEMMRENRIRMIYFEIIFSEMYRNLPRVDEVFRYLYDSHFTLVSFYSIFFQKHLASWTDALFINREFHWRETADG